MLKLRHWNDPSLSRLDVLEATDSRVLDQVISMEEYNKNILVWKELATYAAVWEGNELLFYGEARFLSPLGIEPEIHRPPAIAVADLLYDTVETAVAIAMSAGVLSYNNIIGILENIKLNVYDMIPPAGGDEDDD